MGALEIIFIVITRLSFCRALNTNLFFFFISITSCCICSSRNSSFSFLRASDLWRRTMRSISTCLSTSTCSVMTGNSWQHTRNQQRLESCQLCQPHLPSLFCGGRKDNWLQVCQQCKPCLLSLFCGGRKDNWSHLSTMQALPPVTSFCGGRKDNGSQVCQQCKPYLPHFGLW